MRTRMQDKVVIAAAAIAGVAAVLATVTPPAHAEDKKPKPKPAPAPLVFHHVFDVSSPIVMRETPGTLAGRLHIVVETTFDADGNVVERRLHANLMDAFATSLDGSLRLPATGSDAGVQPGRPCSESSCPADVWTLGLTVAREAFTLRLATTYDADGAVSDATILRGDGPPALG